jgi:hypothetical protein
LESRLPLPLPQILNFWFRQYVIAMQELIDVKMEMCRERLMATLACSVEDLKLAVLFLDLRYPGGQRFSVKASAGATAPPLENHKSM